MTDKKQDVIDQRLQDLNNDGIDRRGFLTCMAWAGTGLVWTMSGGIPVSRAFAKTMDRHASHGGDFSFVQISDSHMGFNKPANPDVVATLQAAVDKINGLTRQSEFLLHTGDISHLSKPEQFDDVDQILKSASAKEVFYVPGEHDVLDDNGKSYLERYGRGSQGAGWNSFDKKGVHFIGLVNVMNLKAGGLGSLGGEQLEWMEKDVKHLKHSTPIVVFAHIPLWSGKKIKSGKETETWRRKMCGLRVSRHR
jgi:3',5'-cyclic AMP phosphodiesterase CpdA